MSLPVLGLFILPTLVTFSHAGFLLFAKHHQQYPREKRERWWQLHLWINGILWVGLFTWVIGIQWYLPRTTGYPVWAQTLGLLSMATGLFLIIRARLLLGHSQAMGIRFFFPEKGKKIHDSLYRYLHNPMYDGFLLVGIGLGLAFGIAIDFYVAAYFFLLFNVFLAAIENYEWNRNPF